MDICLLLWSVVVMTITRQRKKQEKAMLSLIRENMRTPGLVFPSPIGTRENKACHDNKAGSYDISHDNRLCFLVLFLLNMSRKKQDYYNHNKLQKRRKSPSKVKKPYFFFCLFTEESSLEIY